MAISEHLPIYKASCDLYLYVMRFVSRSVVFAAGLVLLASAAPAAMLKSGDAFPVWELEDQTSAKVSSRDLSGKSYLLWFYPKAMTPGCTAEGQGLRDHFAAFQQQKVEILGISFDTPKANSAFVSAERFPFRLLSDTQRTLALAVGAADSSTQPVARRISYLVGPDGKVKEVYNAVNPGSHATDVLNDLATPAD